jgi:hypothetical protein
VCQIRSTAAPDKLATFLGKHRLALFLLPLLGILLLNSVEQRLVARRLPTRNNSQLLQELYLKAEAKIWP